MAIAYVAYKLVIVNGAGYAPYFDPSVGVTFEGGAYTDNIMFSGYLFGTDDAINKAVEKAAQHQMVKMALDQAKGFALKQVPVNTVIQADPEAQKYTGLPELDGDGRLFLELSDTEWDQPTVNAGNVLIDKSDAYFELSATDYEMARAFEDVYTKIANGIDVPAAAVAKINARREAREKITGTVVNYPDWTGFRHWLTTEPEGQAVMATIVAGVDTNPRVAIYNTWMMDQLRQGDISGVQQFAADLDDLVEFSAQQKSDVNGAATTYNLPAPIFP